MSDRELPGGRASQPGHIFQGVRVSGHAKVHLGDNYNINHENPLGLLPVAQSASFNSFDRQHEPTCLQDTRVDLLQRIYDWADGQDKQCIFWLSGLAGTGKSTIARTVARSYFDQKRLGASFFFTRGGGDVGHARKFFTSFAVQLAYNLPQIRRFISDAVIEQHDIATQSLRDQWRHLVFYPLSKLEENTSLSSYVLIIDALDQCDNADHIQTILQLMTEVQLLKIRLRVLITSRPEVPIRYCFHQIPYTEHHNFILHNIEAAIVDHDIFTFLCHEMRSIRQEWALGTGWPDEQALRNLVFSANGLFIWAATACRFIREGREYAAKRLLMILEGGTSTLGPEHHLNAIYTTVLKSSMHKKYLEAEKEDRYLVLKQVLGTIVLLYSPLSIDSLYRLLYLPKEVIEGRLADLHAILNIPKDTGQPLRLHHPSFRDFLLNKDRCNDPNFFINEKQVHQSLANNCICLMSDSLRQDVCRQKAPGILIANVRGSQIEQYLPPEVRYACLYWIQHLQKSEVQLLDNGLVHQFLQVHLLHWLEALSWIEKTSEGILAIISLEAKIIVNESPNLYAFVHDAKRFALFNRSVIEERPLQIYCSSLVFAPKKSIIRKQFKKCIPAWIQTKLKVKADWDGALQLEGHSGPVESVTFSKGGKQVVSGSGDCTVRTWDAVTGAALQTLVGHSSSVYSVAFSPDGKQVVSGSFDKTVRIWDAVTGAALQTLVGHTDPVYSVAFSPDGKKVVSGSDDRSIQIWDSITGAALQSLKGHLDRVSSVAFSPDSKQVISGSSDSTVRIWDTMTGSVLQTLEGHSGRVYSVALSLDGKQVASGSGDCTIRVWDTITGAVLQTLKGHSGWVSSVAFSIDGKQVVSGSSDSIVRIWDTVTGSVLQTLEGHSGRVYSVAFSPDSKQVAYGSDDITVGLWDTGTGAAPLTFRGHSDGVNIVSISPDGKQVVSVSNKITMHLWDTVTGAVLLTIRSHSYRIYSAAFSPDSKQVVSGCDSTLRIWDAVTGAALRTLWGHSDLVCSAAFSPDSKQVVSGSYDKTVRIWAARMGDELQTLRGHSGWVRSVAFSPDGKQVVSGSSDETVRIWDAATGAALRMLTGHLHWVTSVAFSPDSTRVVSASYKTVRLWDAATGAALQILEGHTGSVDSVAFLSDGNISPNLFVSSTWVKEGESNLLWLPPVYRATCKAVWNETIVLGHSSGRISIFVFQKVSKVI